MACKWDFKIAAAAQRYPNRLPFVVVVFFLSVVFLALFSSCVCQYRRIQTHILFERTHNAEHKSPNSLDSPVFAFARLSRRTLLLLDAHPMRAAVRALVLTPQQILLGNACSRPESLSINTLHGYILCLCIYF